MKTINLFTLLSVFTFNVFAQQENHLNDTVVNHHLNKTHSDTLSFHQTNDNNHVESQHLFVFEPDGVKIEHLFNGFFFHYNKPTSKWGVWSTFWMEVNPKWGQALFGVMRRFHVKGNGILEVGLGTAVEFDDVPVRISSLITYEDKTEKLTVLGSFEYGGSGHWYIVSANYRVNKFFGAGLHVQRFAASGPRINLHPTKRITAWMTGGIDIENPYGEHTEDRDLQWLITCGLRYNFIKGDLK